MLAILYRKLGAVLAAARLPTRSHCGAEEGSQRVTDEGCLHVTADGFFQDEWAVPAAFSFQNVMLYF